MSIKCTEELYIEDTFKPFYRMDTSTGVGRNAFDTTHNPQSEPVFKAQTHFIYDRHTIEKITTHYDFGPTHVDFDPTHIENKQEKPTHLEKPQEKPTHYDFDPTHLEKPKEKSTRYDIDPTHVKTEPKTPTHDDFDPTHEEENDTLQSLDEVYSNIKGGQVNRTKSDTQPASGEVPVKLPAKMKKSASMKSPFSHFEENKIVEARRPETVRERKTAEKAAVDGDDDVEVDAKADDFINKFKHQLKLQRLDSIIRYKEMSEGYGKLVVSRFLCGGANGAAIPTLSHWRANAPFQM
ncbi:hypothetical protein CTI12_AA440550 [Artemisia annua]|uniref:Uncharacterized protein n=1 Tax=Artemisia annua TaxID=35608 RepID=A0A2U1LS21_ARTAN|nr:hypothetical protein CTI12_AA440550 [Artemisia annua]